MCKGFPDIHFSHVSGRILDRPGSNRCWAGNARASGQSELSREHILQKPMCQINMADGITNICCFWVASKSRYVQ
jgi:hypothetical protein